MTTSCVAPTPSTCSIPGRDRRDGAGRLFRTHARSVAGRWRRHTSHSGKSLSIRCWRKRLQPLRRQRSPRPPRRPRSSTGRTVLEIGSEELPVGDLAAVMEQLPALAERLLGEARLEHGQIVVTATPRRQTLYVRILAGRQRDSEQVVKGPPARAAYHSAGNPTRGAEGFASRQGVPVSSLQRRQVEGGEYVFAVKLEAGSSTAEGLRDLLPRLIAGLHFEKTMRWDSEGIAYHGRCVGSWRFPAIR